MSDKAKRAIITVAGIEVEGFQLPTGEYVMSQSQPAKAITVDETLVRDFLASTSFKSLCGKDYRFGKIPVERSGKGRGGEVQIKPIPIDVAFDFWLDQAFKGNVNAQALVRACGQETLQRRFDDVFEVSKTEAQYEQQALFAYSDICKLT